MNFIKKLLVVFVGILIAFLISEILLNLFRYNPLSEIRLKQDAFINFPLDKFIKWAYIDIHNPFFKYNKDTFSIQRNDIWLPRENNKIYPIDKKENQKRIFILGESVARLFSESILEKELLKYFDNIEVINIGMGAYDSYRIEKISKEIKNLNPDYVIVCMGNNEGIYEYGEGFIDPLDINWLQYKYPIIRKFKALMLLSNFICPEKKLTKDTVETNFKNNILKICNNLKNTNIIFCDLPNNEYYRSKNNDIFNNIIQKESLTEYEQNIWKNNPGYYRFLKRIEFLKQTSKKYNNVDITNLTEVLRNYTNNKLGYNVFCDECHFSDATYLLLSKIITKIIVKKEKGYDINLDLSIEEYLKLLTKDNIEMFEKRDLFLVYCIAFEYLSFLFEKDIDEFYKLYDKYYINFEASKKINDSNKLVVFADVLQDKGKIKESKKMLNEIMKISPDNFEAYLIMGYIEYKNNNFETADKYFAKAKELNENSDIDVAYLKSLK